MNEVRLAGVTIRVLRVADVDGGQRGGMVGYMRESGDRLRANGFEVAFAFANELGGKHGRLRRFTVLLRVVRLVVGARLRGHRFDVVEIHEPAASLYACLARIFHRWLPVCVVLSYGVEERSWRARLERAAARREPVSKVSRVSVPSTVVGPSRLALRAAAHVAVPSTADVAYLVSELGRSPATVTLAPTGVAESFLDAGSRRGPGAGFRLVFVGSWIDRKGTPELLDAFRVLSERHPRLTLAILGCGAPAESVLRDVTPSLRERVTVRPHVTPEALTEELLDGDVFVLPSWFEGMPLSMLEAAATGLPSVVGAVCGNLDFFAPEEVPRQGGLLVEPHSAPELCEAIERVLSDEALQREMSRAARLRAAEFRWNRTADALASAYRSAVASS